VQAGTLLAKSTMRDKDLFISYSSRDRAFVEKLARDLVRFGVRVWWDQGEIKVGDSLNRRIQEGIFTSRGSILGGTLRACDRHRSGRRARFPSQPSQSRRRVQPVAPIAYRPCRAALRPIASWRVERPCRDDATRLLAGHDHPPDSSRQRRAAHVSAHDPSFCHASPWFTLDVAADP
jgi:hypothetical protein